MEVLAPEELREKFREWAERLGEIYNQLS